ncbi:hypothetical protein [Rhizobium sp. TRM95796]|uniref:hypothetical protein n=1 Tax=Rhizobium sp. TRM95796 TaxID=2979862 RepID=UPI0021E7FB92|nr:hypothetical protein [Rhizobium sp. TRM95796]MCV3765610.1 hypothetical protein [Rhizobium sp. TRM95796]
MAIIDQLVLAQNFTPEPMVDRRDQPASRMFDILEVKLGEWKKAPFADVNEKGFLIADFVSTIRLHLDDADRKSIAIFPDLG